MSDAALMKAYFDIVLKKDPAKECWTEEECKEYAALKLLYEKYGCKRTPTEFLKQVLGGQR